MKIEKDTLTSNISGKEFHVIIPLWRTQCFVLDLFRRKILIWLLVLLLWLWVWLLISKLDFNSSSIFECNTWKTQFETWSLYWSESLSILLHLIDLKYALVCSLYAIYCTYDFLLENEDFEVLFWYVPCHASIQYDKYGWISEVYDVFRIVSGRKRFSLYKSPIDFATFIYISVIRFTKFNFFSMYAQKLSNRSFINCIVAYTDIREIYIFIIREQHVLGFIYIDANFIWFQPSVKTS